MTISVFLNAGYNGANLSDGLAATTANTGCTAVNSISPSTNTWKSDTQFGGNWSLEASNNTGTQAATVRAPFPSGTLTPGLAWDFVCPALPTDSNAVTPLTLRRAAGVLAQFQILQSGQWNVLVGVTSMTAPKTSANATPAALVPGNKYRFEIYVSGYTSGGTTAVFNARLYNYGADASTYLSQTNNGGTAMTVYTNAGELFTHSDVGLLGYPTQRTVRHSNLRLDDAATGYMGPYVATTPSFDYTFIASPTSGTSPLSVNFSVTRVAGTGTGNTMTASVDFGDGTSSSSQSVTGTTPATFTHTYSVTQATDFTASTSPVLTA